MNTIIQRASYFQTHILLDVLFMRIYRFVLIKRACAISLVFNPFIVSVII